MELTGKVALITGGRRMGSALAERLGNAGVELVLTYNDTKGPIEDVVAKLQAGGRKAGAIKANLSDPREVSRAVTHTVSQFGRLDILINMASVYQKKPFDNLTDDDWTKVMDVDVFAAYRLARAVLPHMRGAGGGRIVNVSDWTAASGRPEYTGYVPYYVAKRAVIALTEALALELAPHHILVNALALGPILPPTGLSASDVEAVERATPLGHWGQVETVAKAVMDLLQWDFVTGETIRVDGGRHLK